MQLENLVKKMERSNELTGQKVAKYINSYQYRISLKILGQRIERRLSRNQAAKLAGLSLESYYEFENGINQEASRAEYLRVLEDLSQPTWVIIKSDSVSLDLNDIFSDNASYIDDYKHYQEVDDKSAKMVCEYALSN